MSNFEGFSEGYVSLSLTRHASDASLPAICDTRRTNIKSDRLCHYNQFVFL